MRKQLRELVRHSGAATGITSVEQAAGWLGMPLAVFARYGGLALLLEESKQPMVRPLGLSGERRGNGGVSSGETRAVPRPAQPQRTAARADK